MSEYRTDFSIDAFRQNWRTLKGDLDAFTTALAGTLLAAGRSGGQGISSATAADEQLGVGTPDPAFLLDLSAPPDTNREILFHAAVEDATRDRFDLANGTTTANRFVPNLIGSVESTSAAQSVTIQGQCPVANDTGTTPLVSLMARRYTDGAADPVNSSYTDIATRPILDIRNRATILSVWHADGTVQLFQSLRLGTTSTSSSGTTPALIAGLSFNVAAARTYLFEAILFVDADFAGGHKYAMGGTATATATIYYIHSIADATNANIITSRQTALAGAAGQGGATAALTRIVGTIVVNAAGTFGVQFSRNAAAGSSSVLAGSSFDIRPV